MLTSVIEPTSGTARIGGYDIRTQRDEVKKINGLVPQDLALYPTLVATVSRSAGQAEAIGLMIVFALGFLSGSMSPVDPPYRGEGLMATITGLFPQAQAQMAYQTLMLQNGDVAAVLPNVLYLLGLSLVFFLIAVWRFKTE